ncbi:hypothetical protein [Streptomyces sp. NPDC006368]|uniref:hypothetical protein n=1 Tax=Streptomyces sp. NPDC006368 TaxID=3156760 RepID=UPI0033BE0108
MSPARSREALLSSAELGNRFARSPNPDDRADRIAGCPALDRALGGSATTEALGSAGPAQLDAALVPIESLAECRSATFLTPTRDVDVTVGIRTAAP